MKSLEKKERQNNRLEILKAKYQNIYLIISPPRSASTAVARLFWQFPGAYHYCHEPYEKYYYEGLKVTDAYQNLESPLVVSSPINYTPNKKSLVIKEMTFQLKDQFQQLANITSHPILFLIRDPRLSISSRISKKIAGNLPTDYPLKENGWEDLIKQIRTAEDLDFSYKILDTTQFRIKPEFYIKKLCSIYGIKYKPNMLSWTPKPDLPLDNLNGKHRYLYARVLESTGIEPPIEPIPDISKFSENNDVRAYVNQATLDFHKLKRSRKVIRP